jgi:HD superfamily phosphohydrolase
LTLGILSGKTSFFRSLHEIIDSDLDADRLDYVTRDLLMSGISREPLRYERLLSSYQMVVAKPAMGGKGDSANFQHSSSLRLQDFQLEAAPSEVTADCGWLYRDLYSTVAGW